MVKLSFLPNFLLLLVFLEVQAGLCASGLRDIFLFRSSLTSVHSFLWDMVQKPHSKMWKIHSSNSFHSRQ